MQISYLRAISDALREEMRRDADVLLCGEDVAEFGNPYGVTRGMLEEFGPARVRNTPVSETAIVSAALGASLTGLRPVAELSGASQALSAFAEIFHCVAGWPARHGAGIHTPLVIRCATGALDGAELEALSCVESLFLQAPGLVVVSPSTPKDAKGLLKAAIRSDEPVLFCENRRLYAMRGMVPDEEYVLPIGAADIKREGKDVTVIAIGGMVHRALEAAETLAGKDGIDVEVIDPRTIAPFDRETVFRSLRKTHRAMIVEEGGRRGGLGAELAAMLQEELYDELDGPIARVAAAEVPPPYHPALSRMAVPTAERIASALRSQLDNSQTEEGQ